VKFFAGEYLAKLQARVCLSQALAGLANTLLKDEESALDNHVCRCGGILNTHLTVNLLTNLLTKIFCKSVKIWQNYGHVSVVPFFGPPCTCPPNAQFTPPTIHDTCRVRRCELSLETVWHSLNS